MAKNPSTDINQTLNSKGTNNLERLSFKGGLNCSGRLRMMTGPIDWKGCEKSTTSALLSVTVSGAATMWVRCQK